MSLGNILQCRFDLLGDRVLSVHMIRSNSIKTTLVDGGERARYRNKLNNGLIRVVRLVSLSSGMERTSKWRVSCGDFFFEVHAVNGTLATSALLIQIFLGGAPMFIHRPHTGSGRWSWYG